MIRRPDPIAAKTAELAELRARVRMLESQKSHAEAKVIALQNQVVAVEDECPECEDICALEQECVDAGIDLLAIQSKYNDQYKGCTYITNKFNCAGLNDEICLMTEIMRALECEREERLAAAAYNVAFCKAKGAPEYIADLASQLETLACANPDIDKRCMMNINEVLNLACA